MSSISWVAIDLTLTTSVAPCVADDRRDDRVRLGGVARPVDRAAGRGHGRLEPLEQRRQVAQHLVLDRGAGQPERLPVGALRDGGGPLRPDRRGRAAEVRPELVVGQRGSGRLGERRRAAERRLGAGPRGRPRASPAASVIDGAPVAARISARCMTRTGDRRRDSRPPMCIRHDVSPAVRTSAPDAEHVVDLVEAHRHRRVGVLDRERAAEPAAGLGARQVDERQAVDRGQQPRRPIAHAEQPGRVAGRVERDGVREARADVGHAEDVDEELGQLVAPAGATVATRSGRPASSPCSAASSATSGW